MHVDDLDTPALTLDLDRAVGQQRGDGADRGQHRREHRANDADGQRKLGHDTPIVVDTHAPDVALIQQSLQLIADDTALLLDCFPPRVRHERSPIFSVFRRKWR